MAILDWPELLPAPNGWLWEVEANTQQFISPWTRTTQTVSLTGSRWHAMMEWQALTGDAAVSLEVLMIKLRGAAGRLRVPVWHRVIPRGTVRSRSTAVTVRGDQEAGFLLHVEGLPADQRNVFAIGDYVTVFLRDGTVNLSMVTTVCHADSQGHTTLSLHPGLRSGVSDGSGVIVSVPYAVMRPVDDGQGKLRWTSGGIIVGASLEMIESWP